jgi:Secretion system C-terminal sorting domain/SdrD B-like domain
MKNLILIIVLLNTILFSPAHSQITDSIAWTNVKTDGTLIPNSMLAVFKFNSNKYDYVTTFRRTALNNDTLYLKNLTAGQYIFHGFPDTSSSCYQTYLPTYYGDSTLWTKAETINITDTGMFVAPGVYAFSGLYLAPVPIYTTPNLVWNTGTDTIIGNITLSGDTVARMAASGTTVSTGSFRIAATVTVPSAIVTLYDNNGQRLAFTYTDALGNYRFKGISAGNYTIKIDYTGTDPIAPQTASVDGNPSTKTQVSFIITKSISVTNLFQNQLSSNAQFAVYPNPAKENLTINFNGQAGDFLYSLTDLNGKIIQNGICNSTLDISDIAKGIYFLKIQMNDSVGYKKVIIE